VSDSGQAAREKLVEHLPSVKMMVPTITSCDLISMVFNQAPDKN
jgi:hypothetical protein